MKRFICRGTAFFMIVVLLAALAPGALAQSTAVEMVSIPEPERDVFSEPVANTGEPVTEAVIEPVLISIGAFSEGMIRVTDGSRWGYALAGGTVLIPVQFEAAENFELGVANVTLDGKIGLLHWSGEFLFDPEYDELVEVGYGLYLGRRGDVWDLLSTAPVSVTEGDPHCLYSGLTTAYVTEGINGQLILCEQDGTTTRVLLRNLPQWLKSKKVSGWQFPLYTNGRASFTDVSGRDWFDRWVNLAYSMGMMGGTGKGQFSPKKELTVAETLRLAACLESRAIQDDFHLQSVSGAQWYSSSVTYCEAVGIISYGEYAKGDFNRPITRAEMARIFGRTTAVRSMENINDLEQVRNSVPDVKNEDYAAEAIYGLFAKGVFAGKDSICSFHPNEHLTRAEAATMIVRITRPEHRITLW